MRNRSLTLGCLVGSLCTSACRDHKSGLASPHDTSATILTPANTTSTAREKGAVALSWPVTADSVGPIHFGMELTQLANLFPGSVDPTTVSDDCTYPKVAVIPADNAIMVEFGKVVRYEIVDTLSATAEGVRVGESEDRVRTVYAGHIHEAPADGDQPGQHLIVTPHSPADTTHQFVFYVDRGIVGWFRAGVTPAVRYVEGCL
jgi:hypothetical protein